MYRLVKCPACGVLLGSKECIESSPDIKIYERADDFICGNCGQDMRVMVKKIYDEMKPKPITYKLE